MIKWHEASDLIWVYIKTRVAEQIKAVSFIVLYLFFFQTLVLNLPIADFPVIAFGIVLVVFGLTFFMEGLLLGVMPIGEALGLKLPSKLILPGILLFALILGLGATFAEPAIGILRAMGESVQQTETPLLHYILNHKPLELVISVGVGVGFAVVLGVLRFLYNWSLKPMIFTLVPICLGLSAYALFNQNFAHILGLAWDCGAVTTGPVTVPLVIALGLGISRVVTGHADEGTSSGFGVVTLASLMPIIAVLLMALYLNFTVDLSQVPSIEKSNNEVQAQLSTLALSMNSLKSSLITAAQAILPLCFFMFIVYRVFLREKFAYLDEIVLGIVFSLIGMTLFNLGIEMGLGKLGKQVGNVLPAAYTSIKLTTETKTLDNFDLTTVQTRYLGDGTQEQFFYFQKDKKIQSINFQSDSYNSAEKTYTFTPEYGPIWGQGKFSISGVMMVLLFAFLMGYGATLAEPALNTLGKTVEDISVGTFKKSLLIQTVAIGVGIGIMVGVSKIIWNIPLFWLLTPSYIFLIFLSSLSTEDFVNIAWDSAGVTTGPVTVPLVLAIGLGIGTQSGALEGFGILAMASVAPIMSVLIMGLVVKRKRHVILLEEDLVPTEDNA